jgi:hypothetical protein
MGCNGEKPPAKIPPELIPARDRRPHGSAHRRRLKSQMAPLGRAPVRVDPRLHVVQRHLGVKLDAPRPITDPEGL